MMAVCDPSPSNIDEMLRSMKSVLRSMKSVLSSVAVRQGPAELLWSYYKFRVTAYCPWTQRVETMEACGLPASDLAFCEATCSAASCCSLVPWGS